jgi:hypothetical protein
MSRSLVKQIVTPNVVTDIIAGEAGGSQILKCRVILPASASGGKVLFYLYDGSTSELLGDVDLPVRHADAERSAWYADADFSGSVWLNDATHKLQASTPNSNPVNVLVTVRDQP